MYPMLPSANSRHHVHLEPTSSQRSGTVKRSSSMIFRIEQLLPNVSETAAATTQDITQAAAREEAMEQTRDCQAGTHSAPKRLKSNQTRSGVYVAQFTPKDTRSETFSTLSVMSTAGNVSSSRNMEPTAYCNLSNGTLCMTPAILRKIKLSEDIHSYNALFEIHNGNVRVRVIRDIGRDDELVAWFGEEATLLMSIPFLTPLNIQGNNRYTCHQCHLTFETPNPLKIHLALGCGRHSMDILWMRLHYALKARTFGQQLLPIATHTATAHFSHSLLPSPGNPTASSPTSNISPNSSPQRLSAFKPITSAASAVATCSTMCTAHAPPALITTTASTSRYSPNTESVYRHSLHPPHPTHQPHPSHLSHPLHASHPSHTLLPHMSLLQSGTGANPLNAAAQIEAIVSNMGASKQGHLCIYCGKVYSRKYGLKIHIRTHTGFKPLKCKFCLRPFGDPSNLNKHVRLHLQAGPSASMSETGAPVEGYKCHLCHKTLARRRDLQRHMESRHGQTTHAQRGNKTQRK